jgi:SAM-dependent methyltransferase
MKKKSEPPSLYDNPYYYELAFSFRDIAKEVDFFERCIKKFSKISVKEILDVACGPSPYMPELAKRRYTFTGLDLSEAMLKYSMEKAKKAGIKAKMIHADMRTFQTGEEFDFVFCMLGSIAVESADEFLSHLDSVANCLRNGGIYLIDGSVNFDWTGLGSQSWTIIKDDLTVNISWEPVLADFAQQKIIDKCTVEVIEEGRETKVLRTERMDKVIFPQEFLGLVERNGKFEFVGWFNNFSLEEPMENAKKINRPVTLLRRK